MFVDLKVLVENKTYQDNCLAEHGLSLYIDLDGRKILFDTGKSDMMIHNARQMGVDLSEIDVAVISHGHYDHTGGVPAFCDINRTAPVIIHKNAFKQTYARVGEGELSKKNCGIRWAPDAIKERLVLSDGAIFIDDNTAVSGSIPPQDGFEPGMKFYENDNRGLVLDGMEHEQFLAFRGDDGIYLFCGCCHLGVMSGIHYAQRLFPDEKIQVLVAGMHLMYTPTEEIETLIDRIEESGVQTVVPLHCTGLFATGLLKNRLKDRCILLNTGDSYHWRTI